VPVKAEYASVYKGILWRVHKHRKSYIYLTGEPQGRGKKFSAGHVLVITRGEVRVPPGPSQLVALGRRAESWRR